MFYLRILNAAWVFWARANKPCKIWEQWDSNGSNGFLLVKYVWAAVFCVNFVENTTNPYKYAFD